MSERERELTKLIFELADRLEICARLLGRCAEKRKCECDRMNEPTERKFERDDDQR